MLSKLKTIPTRQVLIGVVLAVSAVLIVAAVGTGKAKAADKGAPAAKAAVVEAPAEPSWTGFGVGVQGSMVNGFADFGAPVNLSAEGQMGGVMVYYNHQFGNLVLGLDASYDRMFGDLHDFGVNYAIGIGLRAGVLPSKSTLIYARLAGERVYFNGGDTQGIGVGGGIEVKVGGPLTVGLEWMRFYYDHNTLGPAIDVSSDRITARAKFDLYSKPASAIFADR